MTLQINISGNAQEAIRNAINTLTFTRAARIGAQALRVGTKKYLQAKNLQPNKKNWPKTNWFQRAAARTTFFQDSTGAGIAIDLAGFNQRYTGSPSVIYPVNAKTIAIPIHPMAYGRRPREFKDLLFIPVLRGRTVGLLAIRLGGPKPAKLGKRAQQYQIQSRESVWVNLYRLVRFVKVKADKTILPTEAEMQAMVMAGIQEEFARTLE
jgi:hypothetical protein